MTDKLRTLRFKLASSIMAFVIAFSPGAVAVANAEVPQYNEPSQTTSADSSDNQPGAQSVSEHDDESEAATADSPENNSEQSDNSSTETSEQATTNTAVNDTTSLNNTTDSNAKSGDATVLSNDKVGNTTTGNAGIDNTTINSVQSSASLSGRNGTQPMRFNADIQGNVTGDFLIDPNAMSKASGQQTTNQQSQNSNQNYTGNTQIANDIDLNATSGNITVSKNDSTGDATTGDANAVANVVNLMNTAIASGQSFIGTINIHGNLDGDILLPPGFLDSLIANNGQNSTAASGTATIDNNQFITNNVTLDAVSGTVLAEKNDSVGNITTGDAKTNLTILNMSSSNIVGANNLLVFVNVLGSWYGVIMDAPLGVTAASVGGGLRTSNAGTNSTLGNFDAESNTTITNDVTVRARSGDITAQSNDKVGNLRTGNATASANIANIMNSSFSLSDWFGVLFINVFGSWKGSFGINTAAGNPTQPGQGQGQGSGIASSGNNSSKPAVFTFASAAHNSSHTNMSVATSSESSSTGTTNGVSTEAGVTSSTSTTKPFVAQESTTMTEQKAAASIAWWVVALFAALTFAAIFFATRFRGNRQSA